jgi:hypothetical protein
MGTNYYAHGINKEPQSCPTCGQDTPPEPLHIGKSSGGWCFSLHVIPERGISDLDDWVSLLKHEGVTILNEYDQSVTLEELLDTIKKRRWATNIADQVFPSAMNSYKSLEEFYHKNHAEPGPNNLIRRRVDGRHCIGQGEGTWDLVVGEFS